MNNGENSVREPHHIDAAPALGRNIYAAPAQGWQKPGFLKKRPARWVLLGFIGFLIFLVFF
jgi:hypothetical protein